MIVYPQMVALLLKTLNQPYVKRRIRNLSRRDKVAVRQLLVNPVDGNHPVLEKIIPYARKLAVQRLCRKRKP